MSVVKINITKDHLNLVKALSPYTEEHEVNEIPRFKEFSPLGISDNMKMDAYHIVYGRFPETYDITTGDAYVFTDEENEKLDKLLSELHLVLDVVLWFTGEKIEPGLYKTKYPLRDWKRIA